MTREEIVSKFRQELESMPHKSWREWEYEYESRVSEEQYWDLEKDAHKVVHEIFKGAYNHARKNYKVPGYMSSFKTYGGSRAYEGKIIYLIHYIDNVMNKDEKAA